MLNKILKGAGTDAIKYFPVRLVPALTSLLTVPVFTSLVNKAAYGDFYLVSSATSLAATFATAWITGSAVRFYWYYERQGRLDEYTATSLWTALGSIAVVSAVLAAITLTFRGQIPAGVMRLIPVGIASLGVNYLMTVLLQVLRAANRSSAFAALSVGSTLASTAFSVFFVWAYKWSSFGILFGVLVGYAVTLPFGFWQVGKSGSLWPKFMRRDVIGEFVRYGFPLVPAAVSSWMLVLSDRYVIGFIRGSAEVGLYSVAYGLGEKIMQLIILPLTITMGPVMIQTFEHEGHHLAQRVQTEFTRYFAMATFPLLFGMAAVSKHFMEVFTADQYVPAYPILPIVATGVMCYGLVQIAGNGVALYKRSTIIMSNTLIAAAFNIATNIVFVRMFGYMAAAWTTLASYVVLLGLTWLRSRPYMSWDIPWKELAKVTAAATGMLVIVMLAFSWATGTLLVLLGEVLLGIVSYAVLLLAFRALGAEERAFVVEVGGKIARRLGFART